MKTTKETNVKHVNFNQLEDQFGNLIQEIEIVKYDKRSDGTWVEEQRYKGGKSYCVIEGQIYYRANNSLIKMNMDFDSKNCGVCYAMGSKLEIKKKITGNYKLLTVSYPRGLITLKKQTYSNDTCFYSLQDSAGNSKVNHGSSDIIDLLNQLIHENNVYSENITDTTQSIIDSNNIIINYINSDILNVA